MADRDDLPDVPALAVLEPPPGGLARLRETLDGGRRPRRWWLAVPAVVAVLALWFVMRPPARDAIAPPTANVVADPVVGDSFYWVASSRRASRPRPAQPTTMVPTVIDPETAILPLQ